MGVYCVYLHVYINVHTCMYIFKKYMIDLYIHYMEKGTGTPKVQGSFIRHIFNYTGYNQ